MLEFRVFNPILSQGLFIENYNAFIDKLTQTFPKKWFKDRKISTKKLDPGGFCGGDVEMCAYFHHCYGNLKKFSAYRSFITNGLSTEKQRRELIDKYKNNDEFTIKIEGEEVSLWKLLHFADTARKFFTSQNPSQDIGAWLEQTTIVNCSPYIYNLEESLTRANIKKDRYTIITAEHHAILIINDGKNFYVFDPNQQNKPQPLNSLNDVAQVLRRSFLELFPPNKNFCFSLQSISFTYSKEVDRYVKAMEKKYFGDPKISSLIAEFKAGQIAYESLKQVIEKKSAPDLAKQLNLDSNSYVFADNIPSDAAKLLFLAAYHGELTKVEYLLNKIPKKYKKIHINAKDSKNGFTPLHYAAQNGHTEVVRLLLKNEANIDSLDDDDDTPLISAALCGHSEVVKFLLEKSAKINLANKTGETPLHYAARSGHTEVVRLLLKNKANIDSLNDSGDTPLALAAFKGHSEVVKLLVEKGAKTDLANKIGATPLYFAAQNGRTEVVRLLLESKATVDQLPQNKTTPFAIAAENGYLEIVKLLWQKGANIDSSNDNGNTPLILAALSGRSEVVKFLVEKGAKINLANKPGETPFSCAAQNGHTEVVKLESESKAAIIYDKQKSVERLSNEGAVIKVTYSNQRGVYPYKTAKKNHEGIIKFLGNNRRNTISFFNKNQNTEEITPSPIKNNNDKNTPLFIEMAGMQP